MADLYGTCPHCSAKLSQGVFKSNEMLSDNDIAIINFSSLEKLESGCNACSDKALDVAKVAVHRARDQINADLETKLPLIPIVSLQTPFGWDYKVCGLVTAQSTTGTGWFSDFTSTFTDAFGAQSKLYNQKIKDGENICKRSLRLQALDIGGNAILATDVDYAEVGGDKAMLMVCMTGTAVFLQNEEIMGQEESEAFGELSALYQRFTLLRDLKLGVGFN